ncbi:leucine-rich repeat domain-containing protein [Paludisphaera rhizosphaerae]|uniref:leucine-rich repeat domain-containing protein n=2 Tax=Paludisphaera rhizosphaerae TaxID=2711216 RepID=UPI0019822295|nr:hypothetical protein [Paludisphaera rhizosphaerae]
MARDRSLLDMDANHVRCRWVNRLVRRWSVRGLLVFVALTASVLGWVVNSAHIQRNAVHVIETAGGTVGYDIEYHGRPPDPDAQELSLPAWLLDQLDPDYVGHPTYLEAWDSNFGDRETAAAGDLDRLQSIRLSEPSVSDEGLAPLANLDVLLDLELRYARIGDQGLVRLSGLKSLQGLSLFGTLVTDEGLRHLSRLSELRSLGLGETKITDAGLVHLRPLSKLSGLYLDNTRITDAGLVHLRPLSSLTTLSLQDTHVSDRGLIHLKNLRNLVYLHLAGTRVTDTGLPYLCDLSRLEVLTLNCSQISNAGLETLQRCPSLKRVQIWNAPECDGADRHKYTHEAAGAFRRTGSNVFLQLH